MKKPQPIPDPKLVQQVTEKLAGSGLRAPSRVTVTSRAGQVTLTGTLQYAHQRQSALHAARSIPGVRGVTDRMTQLPTPHREAPKV